MSELVFATIAEEISKSLRIRKTKSDLINELYDIVTLPLDHKKIQQTNITPAQATRIFDRHEGVKKLISSHAYDQEVIESLEENIEDMLLNKMIERKKNIFIQWLKDTIIDDLSIPNEERNRLLSFAEAGNNGMFVGYSLLYAFTVNNIVDSNKVFDGFKKRFGEFLYGDKNRAPRAQRKTCLEMAKTLSLSEIRKSCAKQIADAQEKKKSLLNECIKEFEAVKRKMPKELMAKIEQCIQNKDNSQAIMLLGCWMQFRENIDLISFIYTDDEKQKPQKEVPATLFVPSTNSNPFNSDNEAERFWRTTMSKEFSSFTSKVLMMYYGDAFFTTVVGEQYPALGIECIDLPRAKSIRDYDVICDVPNSSLSNFNISAHRGYTQYDWYSEYSKVLAEKVRFPDRPGYMFDKILTNEKGQLEKIRVHVGTFAENIYSSHVLEYEMYQVFLEFGDKEFSDPSIRQKIRNSLKVRNQIHSGIVFGDNSSYIDCMRMSLLQGKGREALLGVQMIVIIYSERAKQYEVKLIQRSRNVAIKPGVFQFIPSGGFEIINDSDDYEYDDLELKENFSPGCAIFREYLEEFYNLPEFDGSGTGSLEDRLLKDPRIVEIEEMLTNGDAEFHFLGSVITLENLRHELSFALVIHDKEYNNRQFFGNNESKKGRIIGVNLTNFENSKTIWENIHTPSAAMWALFKRSSLYNELLNRINAKQCSKI